MYVECELCKVTVTAITLTFQRKNLLVGVHDGRVGTNWPPEHIVGVGKVDDDDLVLLINLFTHTNEVVRFEC
jgi:hypothetical protein